MLDTVKINHVQHISFTQPRLTDAVSVILRELLSYEHPSKGRGHIRLYTPSIRSSRQSSHRYSPMAIRATGIHSRVKAGQI